MEILVCCLRGEADPAARARLRELLLGTVDWQAVLDLAQVHRVLPFVYRELRTQPDDLVHPGIIAEFKAVAAGNTLRNLRLLQELLELLRILKDSGTPGIPYKGPLLSSLLYGNAGVRQSCDLDILIPKDEIASVGELLRARGYRQAFGGEEYHCGFIHDDKQQVVEIHWGIAPDYHGLESAVKLWRRNATTVRVGGHEVLQFCREDLLLILCIHGTKHGWSRLQWLSDVAELVRLSPGFDWDAAFARARDLGCEGVLGLGLLLAQDLLAAPVPVEVKTRFAGNRQVQRLEGEISDRSFYGLAAVPAEVSKLECNDLLTLRAAERPYLRAAYLLHRLQAHFKPTVEDRESFPLPPAFYSLCYLWRPLRIVRSRLFHARVRGYRAPLDTAEHACLSAPATKGHDT